jgi:hypothetical protein
MTLEDAIRNARELHQRRVEAGFDQLALDKTAKEGLANGQFEESEEEMAEVTEEFILPTVEQLQQEKSQGTLAAAIKKRATAR